MSWKCHCDVAFGFHSVATMEFAANACAAEPQDGPTRDPERAASVSEPRSPLVHEPAPLSMPLPIWPTQRPKVHHYKGRILRHKFYRACQLVECQANGRENHKGLTTIYLSMKSFIEAHENRHKIS